MKHILLVKTSSLGDLVHQMPAVMDIRHAFPDATISWLTQPAYTGLVRLCRGVDTIVGANIKHWRRHWHQPDVRADIRRVRGELRTGGYDAVIDTQGLVRSAVAARLARGPHHGYDRHSIKTPLASLLYDKPHRVSRRLHAVERMRILVGKALGYQPQGGPDYGVTPAGSRSGPVLLFHGTAASNKEWPEADWINLGLALRTAGLDVAITWGNESERQRAIRLARAVPGSRIIDQMPLADLSTVIANARAVVGLDTGLMHLAVASETPVVAIFVATDPGLTGPFGRGRIVTLGAKGSPPDAATVIAATLDHAARGAAL